MDDSCLNDYSTIQEQPAQKNPRQILQEALAAIPPAEKMELYVQSFPAFEFSCWDRVATRCEPGSNKFRNKFDTINL